MGIAPAFAIPKALARAGLAPARRRRLGGPRGLRRPGARRPARAAAASSTASRSPTSASTPTAAPSPSAIRSAPPAPATSSRSPPSCACARPATASSASASGRARASRSCWRTRAGGEPCRTAQCQSSRSPISSASAAVGRSSEPSSPAPSAMPPANPAACGTRSRRPSPTPTTSSSVSEWRDQAALDAHYASTGFANFQFSLDGLLARPSQMTLYSVRRIGATAVLEPAGPTRRRLRRRSSSTRVLHESVRLQGSPRDRALSLPPSGFML